VIDGRQANHSNGATLARTALWMRSLGAVSALNLDGGGSSNLIVRDTATNTYTVCNSPSGGELRKIHTSLLVKLKENG
jgi:exopolysaccharide biosynthesis protein